jgi:hypothetical protein
VLHSFQNAPDGWDPAAGLINVNGVLYGTTSEGGDGGRGCIHIGCGTIFAITPSGVETIVHSFTRQEGFNPTTSLLKLGHFLYGTVYGAGPSGGYGTVFTLAHH